MAVPGRFLRSYSSESALHLFGRAPPPSGPPPDSSGGVPEIGGSKAGFIGLVVGLALIVVLACTAVFFMLRSQTNDPHERHARRVLAGNRADITYQRPLGPPGMRERFRNLFGGRKREGWVRANSGETDEWDASVHFPHDKQGRVLYSPPGSPRHIPRSETSESVELSAPPLALKVETDALPQLAYQDPYTTSPTSVDTHETAQRSDSADSSHNADVARADSTDDRRFSVQSGQTAHGKPGYRSMRKFDNGTKFKESLEF